MTNCKRNMSNIVRHYSPSIRSWETIPDPDALVPTTESGLSALFQEIRSTVGQEAQIVQAVFPNPSLVMQVFLQRVFAQSVGSICAGFVSHIDRFGTDPVTAGKSGHPSNHTSTLR